ncbi:MAG: hypothetical protein J5441_05590 [Clostridia bacterium]|nr:hypothetical protein [Clostridia bacterium]
MFRNEKQQLKKRKNAALKVLLLSAFVTFMCFSMLVGTTYAWLTDSVTSGKNRIVSGSLDIQMNYYNGTEFVSAEGNVFEDVTWQPGAETHRLIQIYNNSDMPVKFAFKANVMNEYGSINTQGNSFLLSDSLVSYQATYKYSELTAAQTALGSIEATCKNLQKNAFSGFELINNNSDLIEPGESNYILLALYMPETGVENSTVKDGMPLPEFDIELALTATQASGTQDSFGSVPGNSAVPIESVNKAKVTYVLAPDTLLYEKEDENHNKYYEIKDAADFARFATAVNKGNNFAGKTVKLTCEEEIDLDGAAWPLTGDFAGTFDGNNKTIKNFSVSATDTNDVVLFKLINGGTVTGGTVKNLKVDGVAATISYTSGDPKAGSYTGSVPETGIITVVIA